MPLDPRTSAAAELKSIASWYDNKLREALAKIQKLEILLQERSCCCAGCTNHNLAIEAQATEKILVDRELVSKAITVYGLGGSNVVLDGIMRILKGEK